MVVKQWSVGFGGGLWCGLVCCDVFLLWCFG